jgi:hypothetical protein
LLLSLFVFLAIGWIHYGSTTYSFWKMESLAWPLILLLALRLIMGGNLRKAVVVSLVIIFALLSVNGVRSSSRLWASSDYTLGIDVPITKIKGDPILHSLTELQVDLGGGWQEMSALVMIEGPIIRSLNDTFFAKMPPVHAPRLVAPGYEPNGSEKLTPLSNGFVVVTPEG